MYNLYIPCALGMERALGNELRSMDFKIGDSGPGYFETQADLRQTMLLLRNLRCAERIFVKLSSFEADDFDSLFEGIRAISWEDWIKPNQAIRVDKVRLHKASLSSIPDIQSVSQKAIFGRLMDKHQLKKVDTTGEVHEVRIFQDEALVKVCLDLSGKPLHQRGWRTQAGTAPLKETIAAAMVLLSGYRRKTMLWDPCCGSGTICLEALGYAFDVAPNLSRNFGIMNMAAYDARVDAEIKAELRTRIKFDHLVRICGSDVDSRIVEVGRSNLSRWLTSLDLEESQAKKISESLKFFTHDLHVNPPELASDAMLITNPPYAERMGERGTVTELYKGMGRLMGKQPSWQLHAITTWPDFEALIGKKASNVRKVKNGNSEAIVYSFGGLSEK